MVTLLLDRGADVSLATQTGATPFYIACQNNHSGAARLCLKRGADVDRANSDGTTSLYIACQKGHYQHCSAVSRRRS